MNNIEKKAFALIIQRWCQLCKQKTCLTECLYFHNASEGNVATLIKWRDEKGEDFKQ